MDLAKVREDKSWNCFYTHYFFSKGKEVAEKLELLTTTEVTNILTLDEVESKMTLQVIFFLEFILILQFWKITIASCRWS